MAPEGLTPGFDARLLTFSQAQGYEDLPRPLQLEELPSEARTHIWNVFYLYITSTGVPSYSSYVDESIELLGDDWEAILYEKHLWIDNRPLENWNSVLYNHIVTIRESVQTLAHNEVFDLIQFVLRHPKCPSGILGCIKEVFERDRLAYTIDEGPPTTIIPAVTREEGNTIVAAMTTLRDAGLGGSVEHLRNASECINRQDWAGSVRESIHAVESVARQLDHKASNELGPALASLEQRGSLHPALKKAFSSLYGYTSNEQGIRHALLDQDNANVGMDEAVFMLGACASFCSYLWRKHKAGTG